MEPEERRRRCEQGELVTADFEEGSFAAEDQELGAVIWERERRWFGEIGGRSCR